MARKKIDQIMGLGHFDKLTVQKSRPLFALWRSDLTLSEFKILDTYLARITAEIPKKEPLFWKKVKSKMLLEFKKSIIRI